MAHCATGLTTVRRGGDACDWDEAGETGITSSDVEIVPIRE